MTVDKTVKLKQDTIEFLKTLKITKRESYDEVINRIILQNVTEDQLELNQESKKILMERIQKLNEGRVSSFNDIIMQMRKKRGVAKRGTNKSKPWESNKNATVGS